jgi:hypothetical protein
MQWKLISTGLCACVACLPGSVLAQKPKTGDEITMQQAATFDSFQRSEMGLAEQILSVLLNKGKPVIGSSTQKYAWNDAPNVFLGYHIHPLGDDEEEFNHSVSIAIPDISGKGTGRSGADAAKSDATNYEQWIRALSAPIVSGEPNRTAAMTENAVISAYAIHYKKKISGLAGTDILIYLKSSPDDGETHIGSIILNSNTVRGQMLTRLDDMLRIGFKWAKEKLNGIVTGRGLALSPVSDEESGYRELHFFLQETSEGALCWYVFSDRVVFYSSDFCALATFRDRLDMICRWGDLL